MIIIVGAGLFGSVAAALARKAHQVTVIDCGAPWAASKCSGNLFKPSWLDSLGKEKSAIAYDVLHSLYNVQKVTCTLRPLLNKQILLDWIDPAQVLLLPDRFDNVVKVDAGAVWLASGERLQGKVLVAAGVASEQLVEMPPIKALVGSSLRLKGQIKQPGIYLYAPYKHAVAYNVSSSEIWAGDGAAILAKNWDEPYRTGLLKTRMKQFFKLPVEKAEVRVGSRPYVEGYKSGYFAQVAKNTWVSTGGAKNGLILAAYQARLFMEAL